MKSSEQETQSRKRGRRGPLEGTPLEALLLTPRLPVAAKERALRDFRLAGSNSATLTSDLCA